MRTLIARMRFGRNNNLSSVGSANAAVCVETHEHDMNNIWNTEARYHKFTNTRRKVTDRIPSLTQ